MYFGDVNNLDILTNGKFSEFEGNIKFKKGKVFTINFNLINRKIGSLNEAREIIVSEENISNMHISFGQYV